MRGRFFSGTYLNQVDGKHRLSVPAPFRETIEARSGSRTVVLSPAEHAPCLVGFDLTYLETVHGELEQRFAGDFGPGRGNLARTLFASAESLGYDDNGRIILPSILLELGALTGPALFLGAGSYFELWAPPLLLEAEGIDPRLQRTVRALLQAKGG
jgi:MraZ protein